MLESPFKQTLRHFFSDRIAMFSSIALICVLLLAVLAPWVSQQNPYDLSVISIEDAKRAPGEKSADSGLTFYLGSDEQGRDMLSAIFYGLRISLWVGFVSTLIALLIGASIGLISGYLGGKVDSVLMRIVDIQLSLPAILIALILLAVLDKV
jgi:peptide/nickel transport system permease protein